MIDILMATYNGEKYVEEQLRSIWAQTCEDWRLVIHDDGSSDHTAEVIRDLAVSLNMNNKHEIQFSVNEKPFRSAAGNFMGLLAQARNEYVMFSDQDDVWHENKVEKTVNAMKDAERRYGTKTPILVYSDLCVVDGELNLIAESFMDYMKVPSKLVLSRLLIQNSVTGCTVMMNRPLYQLMKEAIQTEKVVMHDHFAALLAVSLGKTVFVQDSTLDYRQHGDNSVGAANARSITYLWARFCRGRKKFREDMNKAMIQAQYFYELYGSRIPEKKKRDLISGFANLSKQSKKNKIQFYLKNHVIKYGVLRAIMQLLWT